MLVPRIALWRRRRGVALVWSVWLPRGRDRGKKDVRETPTRGRVQRRVGDVGECGESLEP